LVAVAVLVDQISWRFVRLGNRRIGAAEARLSRSRKSKVHRVVVDHVSESFGRPAVARLSAFGRIDVE
jgi:hypothetical protein